MNKRNRRGSGKRGLLHTTALAVSLGMFAAPLCADAQNSCDATQAAKLQSDMASWSLSKSSTIDNAQRLVDVSGLCSSLSAEPRRSSYALTSALASELKARALREQKADFSAAAQRAYVMFKFVENDKLASEKDRRDADAHVTEMSDLLQQIGVKQR